jgi:hypothetical protein
VLIHVGWYREGQDREHDSTGRRWRFRAGHTIEGRLQYRSFQDEEGKERGVCEIVADDVQFLSRRGNGQSITASPDEIPA